MRLVNDSRWDGDDVRALVFACARAEGASLRKRVVKVKTFRGRTKAAIGGASDRGFTLKVGVSEKFGDDAVSALAKAGDYPRGTLTGAQLAHVCAAIEWGVKFSCLGINDRHLNWDALRPWAAGLVLRPKVEPKKERLVGTDLQKARIAKAEEKLVFWCRKLKLAQTKIKKYTREIGRRTKALQSVCPTGSFHGK